MTAENKAKKNAQNQGANTDQTEMPEAQQPEVPISVGTPENKKKKGTANKKTKTASNSPIKVTPQNQQLETPQMMNPAEFSLPNVMYFNVGMPENSIVQAFTSRRNPDQRVSTEPDIDVLEVSNTEVSVDKTRACQF